jgi:hypothetical protein
MRSRTALFFVKRWAFVPGVIFFSTVIVGVLFTRKQGEWTPTIAGAIIGAIACVFIDRRRRARGLPLMPPETDTDDDGPDDEPDPDFVHLPLSRVQQRH